MYDAIMRAYKPHRCLKCDHKWVRIEPDECILPPPQCAKCGAGSDDCVEEKADWEGSVMKRRADEAHAKTLVEMRRKGFKV